MDILISLDQAKRLILQQHDPRAIYKQQHAAICRALFICGGAINGERERGKTSSIPTAAGRDPRLVFSQLLTNAVYSDKLRVVFIGINRPGGAIMKDFELGAIQERFADIVWEHEPIASGELAKICEKELSWKRPTTYTVLRKLCEKGLLQNKDGIVVSLVSREEFYSVKSEQIIEDSYRGSLPAFVASFISRKTISAEEADEIQRMIDSFKKGG